MIFFVVKTEFCYFPRGTDLQKLATAKRTNGFLADNQIWEAQGPWFSEIYVSKSPRGWGRVSISGPRSNGCDPVHHETPRGFHRAGWFFHGSPWGIDGTWDTMGLSIAMLYPCCPVSMQIKTCLLQSCTYSFNFKYDFRVDLPVYCSSTSSLLVNSISMSLVLKWEGKELRNKLNKLRNKRVNPVLMSME